MKLLVTGGAGFIGSNFIRNWLAHHADDYIVNLDKLTYAGHLSSTRDFSRHPRYRFVKGDVTHPPTVDKAMAGADWVVHFAAESHVDRSLFKPAAFVSTNVLGTQVLLDAALRHQVTRFHHVSTDEVFGALKLDPPDKFTETTPYAPRSPYSASKAASDHLVRAYFHTFGLPISITNCSNNFGPYQDPEKFIPRMITNLLDGKKVPVYGDGLNVRDWLYVDDHVRAIEAVLSRGRVGETYCVGGQTEASNLTITRKVLRIMDQDDSHIEFVADRPGHDRRYAVDWTKIQTELNWRPLHELDTWLKQTVDWYTGHQNWWRPLKHRAESIYRAKS